MKKKLFIVVEGPDGSGKTSIAKELAKKINYAYFERTSELKANTSKQHPLDYYENLLKKLSFHLKTKLNKSGLIIARYLYSIPAIYYAKTGKKVSVAEDVLKPDIVIYCYARTEILRKRIYARDNLHEHEEEIEKYKRLCKRYEELFKDDKEIIKIDTSNKSIEESINEIYEKLKDRI